MRAFILLVFSILFVSNDLRTQVIPEVTMTDIYGNEHNLYPVLNTGKVVIFNFYFLDCIPCNYYFGDLLDLYNDYGAETSGIEIWVISKQDESEALVDFVTENNFPFHFFGIDGGSYEVINQFESLFDTIYYPNYTVVCPDASFTWDIWPVTDNIWEIESVVLQCNANVSVTDMAINKEVFVYPNPNTGTFSLNTALPFNNVQIFGMDGSLIVTQYVNLSKTIDLRNLTDGLYFAKGFLGNTEVFKTGFIKQ